MVRFSRGWRVRVRMGHPQVRWSVLLMTQDGGMPAQVQGDGEGVKALPLNWMECGKLITLYICRIASWHERPSLKPKLFGSNFASHSGSRAILASACVPRSCMMGMPSGRFSGLPGLGIHIRRTGFTGAWRSRVEMSCRLCGGVRFLAPSTPAVFFPLFSCVTLRTARLFALQDEARSFWSLWAFFVSPRVVAW